MENKIKVGLFGFGCVGKGLYDIIADDNNHPVEIVKICVKDKSKVRLISASSFTFLKEEILEDDAIDVVVEAINNAEEALDIVSQSLKKGKMVVSASKQMIANNLEFLLELQKLYGGTLLYEASSCGSIPIISLLENYFSQEKIFEVSGIFNGSSNYILSKITREDLSYSEALRLAQDLGFAEQDPVMDVGGFDAAHKLCIISKHIFGSFLLPEHIFTQGIQCLSSADFSVAKENGFKIKLIASAGLTAEGNLKAFVLPTFVPSTHELFDIEDEYNAVVLETQYAGRQTLKGKGAGGSPTGSAMFADIMQVRKGIHYTYPKSKTNSRSLLPNRTTFPVYLRYKQELDLDEFNLKDLKILSQLNGEVVATAVIQVEEGNEKIFNTDKRIALISNHLVLDSVNFNKKRLELA